jgi:hypothetical protein
MELKEVVKDHVQTNAKAYAAGSATLIGIPASEHVANVAMWLLSLAQIVPPEAIQASMRYLLAGLFSGLVTRYVTNKPS